MTSRRQRKKTAAAVGLSEREYMLAELVEELIDECRWLRVMGYANQYLVGRHVEVSDQERDRVIEAATRAVEREARLHEWRARIAQVKSGMLEASRAVDRAARPARDDGSAGAADAAGHGAGDGAGQPG